MLPFVPQVAAIDQDEDKRLCSVAKVLAEVIASQNAMLEGLGKHGANSSPNRLAETYRRQLEAVRESLARNAGHIQVLAVDY